jgi:hypothetical protein
MTCIKVVIAEGISDLVDEASCQELPFRVLMIGVGLRNNDGAARANDQK